jgi:hypothetical protein
MGGAGAFGSTQFKLFSLVYLYQKLGFLEVDLTRKKKKKKKTH